MQNMHAAIVRSYTQQHTHIANDAAHMHSVSILRQRPNHKMQKK